MTTLRGLAEGFSCEERHNFGASREATLLICVLKSKQTQNLGVDLSTSFMRVARSISVIKFVAKLKELNQYIYLEFLLARHIQRGGILDRLYYKNFHKVKFCLGFRKSGSSQICIKI